MFSHNRARNESWPSYYERKQSAQRENKLLPLSGACEVSSMCYVTLQLRYLHLAPLYGDGTCAARD